MTFIPVVENRVEFIKSITQTSRIPEKIALETALEVIEELHEWAKAHVEEDQARANQARANLPF